MNVCDNRGLLLLLMMHVDLIVMRIAPVMMFISVEWHLHVMRQSVLLVYHKQVMLQVVVPPLSVAPHAAEDNEEGDEDPPNDNLGNATRSRSTIDSTFAVSADTRLATRRLRAGLTITQVIARVGEIARVRIIIVTVGVLEARIVVTCLSDR